MIQCELTLRDVTHSIALMQLEKARAQLPCLDAVSGVELRGCRHEQAAGLCYHWEIIHVCLSTGTECVGQSEAKLTLFSYS